MFLIHQPDDDGAPSVYPQFNTIEKNLMIANYNSQEAVEYACRLRSFLCLLEGSNLRSLSS